MASFLKKHWELLVEVSVRVLLLVAFWYVRRASFSYI